MNVLSVEAIVQKLNANGIHTRLNLWTSVVKVQQLTTIIGYQLFLHKQKKFRNTNPSKEIKYLKHSLKYVSSPVGHLKGIFVLTDFQLTAYYVTSKPCLLRTNITSVYYLF